MKHLTLNQSINQLELVIADIANTEDKERRHEAKNLLACVYMSKEILNEGDFEEADFILNEVGKRVNEIISNQEQP